MEKESLTLRFLYNTFLGRCILKILASQTISKIVGAFLSSPLSKFLIKRFVKKNNIDENIYYMDNLKSFNDCFTRKIKEQYRPVDKNKNSFISPCDGLLSAYKIEKDLVLPIKQSNYTITSLLKNETLAKKYQNGIVLVFRLCVNHYHRYIFIDDGTKEEETFIKGKLHTVRPIALEKIPVFTQNSRTITLLHTKNFKDITQVEVGALLVGKIKNHQNIKNYKKGQEKGMFQFGGSTIILLLEKDSVEIKQSIFNNTKKGKETPVKLGETIGKRKEKNEIY